MSSDGKEPGATWQGPSLPNWKRPFQKAQSADPVDQDELPPLPGQQQQGSLHLNNPIPAEEDFSEAYADDYLETDTSDRQTAPASTPTELLQQVWQYVTFIVAPLLFGGLTSLFVLPLVATGNAKVPPGAFWPLTLVIVLIAIAQGIAVYYAGSNNGMWALGTAGGFFLFLLVGCFSVFGLVSGLILLVLLIALSVAIVRYYVRPIPEGQVDITYAFGKYSRTLYAGPNVLFPWEKVNATLNVEETQWTSPTQRVQLSRDEDVILRATISYQLLPEDAYLAVTEVKEWEKSLHQLLVTNLQALATTFSPDDFIVWPQGIHRHATPTFRETNAFNEGGARWERVNTYLFQMLRDKVALWGVQINWVHILDVVLAPHDALAIDTEPVVNKQAEKVAAGVASSSAGTAAPKKPPATANAPDPAKRAPQPQRATVQHTGTAANSTPPHPATPLTMPKEDVLIKAYREIQSGKITDPETIRNIAIKFEAIAQDPQLSQAVSFDAERAAENLYAQAERCKELYESGMIYNDETKPDWLIRSPNDDNKLLGG